MFLLLQLKISHLHFWSCVHLSLAAHRLLPSSGSEEYNCLESNQDAFEAAVYRHIPASFLPPSLHFRCEPRSS